MFSTALLVLSGIVFYFAVGFAALGAGTVGHWAMCVVMLVLGLLTGGVGWLLLLASHACRRWRDARRQAGLMFVCVGVLPLSAALMLAVGLFDPATLAIVARGNPKAAAILAVPIWRLAMGAVVPALVITRGIGLICSAPPEVAAPRAGFSSSASGS